MSGAPQSPARVEIDQALPELLPRNASYDAKGEQTKFGYTADQMRAYAIEARATERAKSLEVARLIMANDRTEVVKWASGLAGSLEDGVRIDESVIAAERAEVVRLMGDLRASEEDQLRLRGELKDLMRAYVNLLESARDRIVGEGGMCDSVDKMEASDPALRKARAALATTTQGEQKS